MASAAATEGGGREGAARRGPALLLLELDSIAAGIRAGDAMVKRAPLGELVAGTVQPGRYLLLAAGEVAEVEEAWAAARETAGVAMREIFLPEVDPRVVAALGGRARLDEAGWVRAGEALGVVETSSVPAILSAADAGVKGAAVELAELRLADGLGGKGYLLFAGAVADVEAAVETGCGAGGVAAALVERAVVPRLHGEMRANLVGHGEFRRRVAVGVEAGEGEG